MVCRLSSVQLCANHRESADAVTTPWGGGRVAGAVSTVTGREGSAELLQLL